MPPTYPQNRVSYWQSTNVFSTVKSFVWGVPGQRGNDGQDGEGVGGSVSWLNITGPDPTANVALDTLLDAIIANYITRDAVVLAEAIDNTTTQITNHTNALDPHPQYTTAAELTSALSGYSLTSHTHAGEAIISGTVADARIAATIARLAGPQTHTETHTFSSPLAVDEIDSPSETLVITHKLFVTEGATLDQLTAAGPFQLGLLGSEYFVVAESGEIGTNQVTVIGSGTSKMPWHTANDLTLQGYTLLFDTPTDITFPGDVTATNVTAVGVQITGDLDVDGDAHINGDFVVVSVETVEVEDPMPFWGDGNLADTVDLGNVYRYTVAGTPKYAGLFRDATDGYWRLYSGLEVKPGAQVNILGTGYTTDTFVANLKGNVIGNVTGNVTGNADTATKLATGRTIAIGGSTGMSATGVSFDGSDNISLTLVGTLAVANGGTGATDKGTALTNLGGTTAGQAVFTITNPGAIAFLRWNADNTVASRSASEFRGDISATIATLLSDQAAPALSTSGSITIDVAASAKYILAPTGNITTVTISNSSVGSVVTIRISPSAFTVDWSGITGLKWQGNTAPTLPTTAGRYLLVVLSRWGMNDWLGTYSTEHY